MLKENKFDLVISLGADCACTSYLRRCNLQHYSYPFDWLTHAPFEVRIELLCGDFQNFLNIEDLKPMDKPKHLKPDVCHDYYMNTRNGFYFWHDFEAKEPFYKSFEDVRKKYQRRIKRLYSEIENSNKILFVWFSHKNQTKKEIIQKAYKKIAQKFCNKEIYLLIIENNNKNSCEKLENNHISVIHHDTLSDDNKHHYDPTMGNKTNNLRVFKKIKLKTTFFEKIKRLIYQTAIIFSGFIPNKNLRSKIKSKINMYFYHAKL